MQTFFPVKRWKQSKNCADIFEGPIKILGTEVFVRTDWNRKRRNFVRPRTEVGWFCYVMSVSHSGGQLGDVELTLAACTVALGNHQLMQNAGKSSVAALCHGPPRLAQTPRAQTEHVLRQTDHLHVHTQTCTPRYHTQHSPTRIFYKDRINRNVKFAHKCLDLDLIWCYKIIFGLTCTNPSALFEVRQTTATRGHPYKLFKPQCTSNVRSFFTQRVIKVWNDLPTNIVNFSSLVCFRRSLLNNQH